LNGVCLKNYLLIHLAQTLSEIEPVVERFCHAYESSHSPHCSRLGCWAYFVEEVAVIWGVGRVGSLTAG